MRCIECKCRCEGWDKRNPYDSWCTGVKHPFKIENVYAECTEYFDGDQYTTPTWGSIEFKEDTYRKPTLTVLVGIPGSGKSTYAKAMSASNSRAMWLSSDDIREQLFGDANCQQDHHKVFSAMQEKAIDLLNNGFDVIYDATSINRKSRASILEKVPKHCTKECVIIWAPIDVSIERDRLRDRTVGPEVIDRILRRFEAPFYDEGFDKISVHISDVYYNKYQYYVDLISALAIPHDNPHHSADVMEHCHLCGMNLLGEQVPDIVVTAGFIHDIGKHYTKTFTNRKGETTDIAHYYDHPAVGAWLSYGIHGHNPTLAWLISTHMAPFINQKYYNSLPACYKKWIDALHAADRAAH